jgi:hypothetical protein
MATAERSQQAKGVANLLESRLAFHLRCLAEDATDPTSPTLERLAPVRDRVGRIRKVRRELEREHPMTSPPSP